MEKPSCRDYADALADFLGALGVGRVHLVGNSFGGRVAQCFTIHYAARVMTLTLASPAIGPKELPAEVKAQLIGTREKQIASSGVTGALGDVLLGPKASPELVAIVREGVRATNRRGFMQGVTLGLADGYDPVALAAKAKMPILLISGADDRVNPTYLNAAVLKKAIPAARFEVIEDAGNPRSSKRQTV